MARIMMKKAHNESISEAFEGFMLSAQSRGLTNKTLASYRTHFHSISKRLDIEKPISQLTKKDLEEMIAKMREENLILTCFQMMRYATSSVSSAKSASITLLFSSFASSFGIPNSLTSG